MKLSIVPNELKEVWLGLAKEMSLHSQNAAEFHLRSGNEFIINHILNYLKDFGAKLVFFEHSYFATTLDNNKYTIFVCIWKNEPLLDIELEKFHSFFTEINKFENEYPILWHPDFFISPKDLSFYISSSKSDKLNPDFDASRFINPVYAKEKRVYKVNIDKQELFVGSFPFTLFLEKAVNDVMEKSNSGGTWQPIVENNDRLRTVYDEVFGKDKNDVSYKLAIPILGSPINKNPLYVGQGSVWIYLITSMEVPEIILKGLAANVAGYFKDISINYIFQSGLELAKKAEKQARKAAISQVLGRNMSHNHGSHVLSRMIHVDQVEELFSIHEGIRYILSNKLARNKMPDITSSTIDWRIKSEEVNEMDTSGLFREPIAFDLDRINEISKKIQYLSSHTLNKSLTIYDKISYFNSYMKSRMDFIADIATGTPTMESSKLFYGELIAGIDKNRILLDKISGIDNFKYNIELHDCRDYNKATDGLSTDCRKTISLDNDFAVAIPNDIVGQHAQYIIIENIIRNTAKHSEKKNEDPVTFHIEVQNPDKGQCEKCLELKSYYEINIYDDINIEKIETDIAEDEKTFFKSEGLYEISDILSEETKTMDSLEKLVYKQNIYINQSILTPENTLRQSAWGIIEMEAAAAYLRKIAVEKIDDKEYDLNVGDLRGETYNIANNNYKTANILKAFVKETREGKRHLAYRFFMLKPKEVLIVLDNEAVQELRNDNIDLQKLHSRLINYGIWMTCKSNDSVTIIEKYKENTIYEHEILADMTNEGIEANIGVIPERIVKMNAVEELKLLIDYSNIHQFKVKIWEKYTEKSKINIEDYKRMYRFELYADTRLSAVFDHHGTEWSSWFAQFPGTQQFVEITTGMNLTVKTLEKAAAKIKQGGQFVTNTARELITYFKLFDSIYHQVIILDERIQEAADNLSYKPEKGSAIPFKDIYLTTGIFVPPKIDLDLSKQAYDADIRKNVKSYLSKLKNKELVINNERIESDRIKFMVIHLGVLEKILSAEGRRKSSPKEEQFEIEDLTNDFMQIFSATNIKPIIISGRGLPPNAPKKISFVNFSAVAQHCIDSRNKFILNELLYSARSIDNKKRSL